MLRIFNLLFLLLSLFPLQAYSRTVSDKVEADEVIHMADEEPEMREAFKLAKSTLDVFFSTLRNPPDGTGSYAVKVGIRDGQNTEYFWLTDLDVDGESLTGTISNQPRLVDSVEEGQRYSFQRKEIVDWTYIDETNRRTVGNFTACALISKEPKAEAQEMMRRYGLTCD